MQKFEQWYSEHRTEIFGGAMPGVLSPKIEEFARKCWEAGEQSLDKKQTKTQDICTGETTKDVTFCGQCNQV